MKKEKFLKTTCIVALALSFCVTGCKNAVSMEEPVIVEKSNSEITKAYISRLKYINNFSSARNCEETVYPSLFYELDIEDENGNKIFFENFSSEEKEKFSEFWYDELYKDVLYKIEQDESLGELIDTENSAFEDTINTSAGERAANKQDIVSFYKLYQKNLEKQISIRENKKGERAASKVGEITADCLVDNSVKTLKANYKKGNFLVCTDSSSSSSGSYIGHASMMYRDSWDEIWEKNGLGKATITSSPKNKSAQWKGKSDGVQYEPIGYWAGNASGSANRVSIYEPQKVKVTWYILFNKITETAVSESERNKAVNYAKNNIGKEYLWDFVNKWKTNKFYCSQLVWRSWYEVSSKCDLSQGPLVPFVAPSDLSNSRSAKFKTSYKNK